MTFSKYFYLEHNYIVNNNLRSLMLPHGGEIDHGKLHNYTYKYSVQYIIRLLCKVRSSLAILSMHTRLSIRDY